MKKSINAWSIPGAVPFEQMFREISEAGFDGIELNLDAPGKSAHSLTYETTDAELAQIAELSRRYSLPIASISTSLFGGHMGTPAEEEEAKMILRTQLRFADALGADGILTVPGGISGTISLKGAWENSLRFMKSVRDEIAEQKVFVGLENVWNGFFMSPFDMARFIDELDCPRIGAYFDVGNVAVNSQPEHWIEILGDRIGKIHVKDFQLKGGRNSGVFVNLLQGSINWSAVVRALRTAGYDGYLTAELGIIGQDPGYLYEITSSALGRIIQLG